MMGASDPPLFFAGFRLRGPIRAFATFPLLDPVTTPQWADGWGVFDVGTSLGFRHRQTRFQCRLSWFADVVPRFFALRGSFFPPRHCPIPSDYPLAGPALPLPLFFGPDIVDLFPPTQSISSPAPIFRAFGLKTHFSGVNPLSFLKYPRQSQFPFIAKYRFFPFLSECS